jgi:hypothetical protein
MINVTYSINNMFFAAPKVGQTDGTVAGTSAPVSVDPSLSDIRLVAFVFNAMQCILACNRGGVPGQVGNGMNFILPADISGVGTLNANSPYRQSGLDPHITNPYSAEVLGDYLYVGDYDKSSIFAVDLSTFEVYDDNYVFNYMVPDAETFSACVGLTLINDRFYALFNGYTDVNGVYVYQPTALIRLKLDGSGPGLVIDTSGGPSETGIRQLGLNAVGMAHATDNRDLLNIKEYILITFAGGMQQGGQGNGANSVLTLVNVTDFLVLPNSIIGTATATGGTVELDLHSVAATLPFTLTSTAKIDKGDCWIYLLGATYSDAQYTGCDYKLCETKLSTLIGFAGATPQKTLDDLSELASDPDVFGYFWGLVFAPEANTGLPGKLFFARGTYEGDAFDVYDVDQNGAAANHTRIAGKDLYGEADQNPMLNCVTLVLYSFAKDKRVKMTARVMRSFTPPPVASGQVAMADLVAARKKRTQQ